MAQAMSMALDLKKPSPRIAVRVFALSPLDAPFRSGLKYAKIVQLGKVVLNGVDK